MRFRFTIRDLLWLTAVVGLAVGWWMEHSRFRGIGVHYENGKKWIRYIESDGSGCEMGVDEAASH